jgi:uncharacterized membrane protein
MITVILYSREDCHLCQQAEEDLAALQAVVPHRLKVIDVDSSRELQKRFGFDVPVIEVGPYLLRAPFERQELQVTLSAAQDRENQIEELDQFPAGGQAGKWTAADRFTYWFSRHYVGVLNILVIIYLGLPVLAPVLLRAGFEAPARLIYRGYGLVCHQLSFRSFFIFGEQLVYPREAAHVDDLLSYSQATGLGEESTVADLYQARDYVGNPEVGYKIALCQRDMAIYLGILMFGLIFAISGRRLPALPWYLWLLLGIVPVGLDGLSQLLSQPPMDFLPYRESTPFLRSLTGFLFGFSTAWFGYPIVEETMAESRRIMRRKLERLQRHKQDAVGQPSTAD